MSEEGTGPIGAGGGPSATGREAAPAVEARLGVVLARWGDRLSAEERAAVRRQIERGVELAARLRTVPLGNGDEPEIVFVPFRSGDGAAS